MNDFVCRNQIKLGTLKPLNEEKCEDTKGVIRSRKSKDRQHNDQKCEDTKGVIRSRKSKDRQHNDQKCEDTKGVI